MNNIPKKKFLQIFLFTFLISLIYLFISQKSNNSETSIRNTLLFNFLEQICKESTENLIPFYEKISFSYSENKLSLYSQALINYFLTGDKKYLTHDYLTRISRYISILLLIIIIIITYIICLFCFCFPRCCCKQKGKGNCLRYFSILITLTMSGSLITSSYYGMKMEYKIINSVNGLSCSIFKFISNVYFGDLCQEKPIWSGIFNLISSISDTKNIIKNISYYNDFFINEIEKVKDIDFYNMINKKENFIKNEIERFNSLNITISNPYPNDNSSIIVIDFMKDITNKIESNIKDYENYIIEPYNILNSVTDFNKEIKKNKNNIIKSLDNSVEKILVFKKTFSYFYYDANDKIPQYYNRFMKFANKLFSFLFIYFMCIGIVNIFSIFIFVTLEFKIIRLPIFFFWNIENIIMIITFFFGLIFNLLYLEGKDGRDIISYSLTSYNLNKDGIIFKGEGKKYLNICLNDYGDLQNAFELNNEELMIINDLYNYFSLIKKNVDSTKELKNIKYEIDYFEKYIKNIENSSFYINDTKKDLKNILNELRKYTDGLYEGNYQLNKKIYDVWVFNINNCPNGYKYISLNNNYFSNKKNCLLLTERNTLPFNYSNILTKGDYENLDIAFKSFNKTLYLYYENLKNSINDKILPIFKEYENNLTEIKDIFYINLKKIYTNISNFEKYSNFINQNDSFFSFVNCRFMKRDVNIFFSQIDKLGLNSANFSSIIYTISFSLMFFNLFFFFIIMRYRKEKIKNDVDDIVFENNNPEKEIPISESQSENKISDLINNQNKISFN